MKINAVYKGLVNGGKIIGGYKISLTKSMVEKSGFKNGEEVDVEYKKGKIIIKKIGA